MTIIPTIGMQVLFHRSDYEGVCLDAAQPMAATIAFVHGNGDGRKSVNLSVISHTGEAFGVTGVPFLANGEERPSGFYCVPIRP